AGVVEEAVAGGGAWFDPARRSGTTGRRLLDPEATSPPLSFVLDVAARVPATGAKLAPGVPHEALPAAVAGRGTEAQWTSVDGDVVECALWCGPLARAGVRRSAAVGTAGPGGTRWHEVDATAASTTRTAVVGAALHEPDGAVIRAGLVGAVAAALDGWLIDETIAYVSSDSPARTPLARSYAVEHVMPFGLKPLRAWLRRHDVGRLVVKKRGTAVEPEALRRQLRLQGAREATVVLTRVAGRQSVLVVRPLPPADDRPTG
ncbi:THUMP-like domain-containing protein, partial [Kineococcus glutinatus]|uniref:THUMP-like domain-containing protein n=1 Tax=Kineococcus glutinatus TaxID=1070872 RepID=UPI003CD086EF